MEIQVILGTVFIAVGVAFSLRAAYQHGYQDGRLFEIRKDWREKIEEMEVKASD